MRLISVKFTRTLENSPWPSEILVAHPTMVIARECNDRNNLRNT